MSAKNQLLEKIISDPLHFSENDFLSLVGQPDLSFQDLRDSLRKIFDINEEILLEESDASSGIQGFLNRFGNQRRQNKFYKRFRKDQFKRQSNKVIVAEGDSWFQFPVFVKDIIDHLSDNKNYNIFCLAYGGDWITNIIYEEKYVEKLSAFCPDVFLISGGGNDLVGVDRVGVMVNQKGNNPEKYSSEKDLLEGYRDAYRCLSRLPELSPEEKESILLAQKFINKEFYAFILILRLQYWMIFSSIRKKFPQMQIITQGYDYALPSVKYHWKNPLQGVVNYFLQTGKWLQIPLRIKGITDEKLQRDIVRLMIFEFNMMYGLMASHFENVYHIDSRGLARKKDWYDELHLHSRIFGKVADAYQYAIENFGSCEKIIFSKDFR